MLRVANDKLLSISEFAKLAGTTRRTLIFYDQKDVFKPMKIEETGYRYYSYEQLYQIGFILGLRDIGLSVEEIKDYLGDSSRDALNKKLIPLKNKIELRIQNLKQILAILRQKENDNFQLTDVDFYVVKEFFYLVTTFCVRILRLIVLKQKLPLHIVSFTKN